MPAPPRRRQGLRRGIAKPDYLDPAAPTKVSPKKKAARTKVSPKKKAKKKEPQVFTVEEVLAVKRAAKGNRISCHIKWEGYEETTWEPISYLNGKARKDADELLEKLEGKKEEEKAAEKEESQSDDKKEEEEEAKEEAS